MPIEIVENGFQYSDPDELRGIDPDKLSFIGAVFQKIRNLPFWGKDAPEIEGVHCKIIHIMGGLPVVMFSIAEGSVTERKKDSQIIETREQACFIDISPAVAMAIDAIDPADGRPLAPSKSDKTGAYKTAIAELEAAGLSFHRTIN